MTRIYLVTQKAATTTRLVRATNQAQALRHAVQSVFDVSVASQDDLVSLIASGTVVETAGEEPAPTAEPV